MTAEQDNFIPDLTKPSKEILIDMINWANRYTTTTELKPDTTYFTDPVKLVGQDTNTHIRLAKVFGFYIPQGTEDIYYNRMDINQIAKQMLFDHVVYLDYFKEYKKASDILPELFEVFKVYLDVDDIIDFDLNIDFKDILFKLDQMRRNPNDDYIDAYAKYEFPEITLKINEEKCIGYLNGLTLSLQPKPIHIRHAIQKNTLRTSFMPYPRHGLS